MFQLNISMLQGKSVVAEIIYQGKRPTLFQGYRLDLVLTYGSTKVLSRDCDVLRYKERKIV